MEKYNELICKFSEKISDPKTRAISKKELAPVRDLLTALEAKAGGSKNNGKCL